MLAVQLLEEVPVRDGTWIGLLNAQSGEHARLGEAELLFREGRV
jgi:hypothetical protein